MKPVRDSATAVPTESAELELDDTPTGRTIRGKRKHKVKAVRFAARKYKILG